MKFAYRAKYGEVFRVSTLAVEWIEIMCAHQIAAAVDVSTLAVEWIEIKCSNRTHPTPKVSTLAVEWIEITLAPCIY